MSAHPNVKLPDSILAAAQEAAERQGKSLNEMVGELVMIGLRQQKKTPGLLDSLIEEGKREAVKKYGRVLTGEEIVALEHRQGRNDGR